MTKQEAKQRIEKLKKEINHHRYLYHVLDRGEISDEALDSLKKELADLEGKFPEFITPDSPTQRVGGRALEKFEKVAHRIPMLSFNDAFSRDDMEEWEERMARLLPHTRHPSYFCELKIDGLAIALEYEDSLLHAGSTRGDGRVGEDVTQNLKTIDAVPLELLEKEKAIKVLKNIKRELVKGFEKNYYGRIEVRGEVFLTKREFERINRERRKQNLSLFANPRNIAAGSIRQLDPKITASRRLDSFSYALITDLGQKTHEDEHIILHALGFKINTHNRFCNSLKEVFEFYREWGKKREQLSYEIDGIVVIVNDNEEFGRLGVAGKAPRGAIAYKFEGKEGTTIVLTINVQVGRTGSLTPVAYLEPVRVGGVTISRATLHNMDEIYRLGVKIGDTVIVRRAGDVIPDVVKVLKNLRSGKERIFRMPKRCPICGAPVVKPEAEVATYCTNKDCFGRRREWIKHSVSRAAFNIEGVGEKIAEQLMNEGLVLDPADLFELEEGDLVGLERFAEKSAENFISAIRKSRRVSLSRFIYALGIPHVGEETAIDLAHAFGSVAALQQSAREDLERVRDIGNVVARSIYEWFREKENAVLLKKFKHAGVVIEKQAGRSLQKQSLRGKTFMLTGELKRFARNEAKSKIRELGGDVSGTVSKHTDYVVAGSSPGSKYEKAKKLGVKIIGEKEFLKLVE